MSARLVLGLFSLFKLLIWVVLAQVAELPGLGGAHFMPVTQKGHAMLLSMLELGLVPL